MLVYTHSWWSISCDCWMLDSKFCRLFDPLLVKLGAWIPCFIHCFVDSLIPVLVGEAWLAIGPNMGRDRHVWSSNLIVSALKLGSFLRAKNNNWCNDFEPNMGQYQPAKKIARWASQQRLVWSWMRHVHQGYTHNQGIFCEVSGELLWLEARAVSPVVGRPRRVAIDLLANVYRSRHDSSGWVRFRVEWSGLSGSRVSEKRGVWWWWESCGVSFCGFRLVHSLKRPPAARPIHLEKLVCLEATQVAFPLFETENVGRTSRGFLRGTSTIRYQHHSAPCG